MLADCFFISNLGLANSRFHLVLTEQTVDDDFQMELAHAGNNGLTGFIVRVGLEGGIFFSQLHQSHGHLVLTSAGLGLDGNLDHGIRENHGFQNDLVLFIAERITGGGVFQTDSAGNLTDIDIGDFLAVIGMHQKDTADTFSLLLGGVHDIAAACNMSGVHTEESKLADEGVGHDLESESRERLIIRRMTFHFLFRI